MNLMRSIVAVAAGLALGSAWAALPPPSPAQARAAAAKKAEADAKAAQEKEALAASMDQVGARWRERAAKEGWKIKPPPPVATPVIAGAPGSLTPPHEGGPAAAPLGGAPGTAAAAPATGAAPHSRQALGAAKVPVKSEKLGTALPSEDVKRGPTRAEPAGTPPTVNKDDVPANATRQ